MATGGAAVTINSNNSFDQIAGTTISNTGTDAAVGILVDLTTQNLDATNDPTACPAGDCHVVEGIVENGTIDLSGSGSGKRGVWLQGADPHGGTDPFAFTGNIDMSNSTMTITGDNSVGVLLDQLTILNGNLITRQHEHAADIDNRIGSGRHRPSDKRHGERRHRCRVWSPTRRRPRPF